MSLCRCPAYQGPHDPGSEKCLVWIEDPNTGDGDWVEPADQATHLALAAIAPDNVTHLPRESAAFEFLFSEGQLTVESAVFQALGAASTCWESLDGTGIFDSDRAKAIGDELLAVIAALCETVRQAAIAGTN